MRCPIRALPPMPRKLRPKPRARQGNSHFVGPGKFYADWNEFDADLDKWEDERAARMPMRPPIEWPTIW